MGVIGKIVLGFLGLLLIAVIADIVTLMYEYAWIIAILIFLLILLVVWMKSPLHKKTKIRRLIKAAMVDGKISDKEKDTIIKKAKSMRIDPGEAEIYIDEYVYKMKKKSKK